MVRRIERLLTNRQTRNQLVLTAISLGLRLAMAGVISQPGYMDAAYYAAGAVRIGRGSGFSEPFIWNYLNNPSEVIHPGFLYWMPLPALLGAPFAALFTGSFFALQVPFAILSALVPSVAYGLTAHISESEELAWTAGLLAVFSGFFFPYWTLPETFAPFALFGSLALWLAGRASSELSKQRVSGLRWLWVGLFVGLAHLTRADGFLLLPIVALAPLRSKWTIGTRDRTRPSGNRSTMRRAHQVLIRSARPLLTMIIGYVLVMGPWFARNLAVAGTPLSPAGTKTIWLREYDDLFCYDCDLSLASYLAWGWNSILHSKLSALWINFQRLLAENCMVFLLPFVIVGLHRLRYHLSFLLASIYLILVYFVHSLIFTFPGWRGGFFHASSAVLPFLYAAGMYGLDATIRWVARRRRGWRHRQALAVFAAAAIAAAATLSGYVSWQKLPATRKTHSLYEEVDGWLNDHHSPRAGVMVGNPPAFWYATRRPAIVVPNEGVETLVAVADRYEMRYVLLERDHPAELTDLHTGAVDHPRLQVMTAWPERGGVLYVVQD